MTSGRMLNGRDTSHTKAPWRKCLEAMKGSTDLVAVTMIWAFGRHCSKSVVGVILASISASCVFADAGRETISAARLPGVNVRPDAARDVTCFLQPVATRRSLRTLASGFCGLPIRISSPARSAKRRLSACPIAPFAPKMATVQSAIATSC